MNRTPKNPKLHLGQHALLAFLVLMAMGCKKETSNLVPEKEAPPEKTVSKVKHSNEFAEIYDLIERDDFEAAFDKVAVFDGHVDYGTHLAALRELVDRWLHANPQEALIAFQRIEPEHLRSILLNMHMDIAVTHHKETCQLAQSIDNQATRDGLQYRVLAELKEKDPEMAFSFVTENFGQGRDRNDMLRMVFKAWYKNSPDAVINHYQSFKYSADKLVVEESILSNVTDFSKKELQRFQEVGFSEETLEKVEALLEK